jgi:tRNA A37 methylthiotransferase MiaB
MKKKEVVLFGSVPMSLSELQLAPAIISAYVQKKGHSFAYYDLNLQLFESCKRDLSIYSEYSELLQDYTKITNTDSIIDHWQQFIVDQISTVDVILVNVFSMFSQIPALRIIKLCRLFRPDAKIIVGGIGSHKQILSGVNDFNRDWVEQNFSLSNSDIFGQLCLDNNLIDGWQSTVGMDVLDHWLPARPLMAYNKEIDFGEYKIDQYQWPNNKKSIPILGSHGCVRQCSFCDVIKHFPRYSFVEADVLTKSIIDAYQQTGISKIQFMDSLVNGSMSNFLNLLKNLSQAKKNKWLPEDFSWSGTYICRPRSKLLDKIHQCLSESGADNLVIGVETGSDRIRYQMEKKFLNEDLLDELDAFKKYSVKASALFFPSWPTETNEDFRHTLDLFEKLSRYSQLGVLDSVILGTSGFSLIDGTPIDQNKHLYELEKGPVYWLWKCGINPDLTFWETVRRRLLMAEWCEMYGIKLEGENTFRRYLLFNLSQYQDLILSYSGHLADHIDVRQYLPSKTQHQLKFGMINNHSDSVTVTVQIDSQCQSYVCSPGQNYFVFEFDRQLSEQETLTVSAKFSDTHCTQWARYDSGDYYDQQGIYINQVVLDHSDITHWGWNQSVVTQWQFGKQLPDRYWEHENKRCLTSGMIVCMNMLAYCSPHKHILNCQEPELNQERKFVDCQLNKRLIAFLK